jgi:hypothetical protein
MSLEFEVVVNLGPRNVWSVHDISISLQISGSPWAYSIETPIKVVTMLFSAFKLTIRPLISKSSVATTPELPTKNQTCLRQPSGAPEAGCSLRSIEEPGRQKEI